MEENEFTKLVTTSENEQMMQTFRSINCTSTSYIKNHSNDIDWNHSIELIKSEIILSEYWLLLSISPASVLCKK